MLDPQIFDDLAQNLLNAIPEGMRQGAKDVERNFRSILQSTFARLDLVTREEFDAQCRVLARTREKIEQLEKQLGQLEGKQAK